jgi:AcrR family transcriptional regulator
VAALSMRAVAAELGMSTMALYRYVEDREELERLVVDLVLEDLDLDMPRDLPWEARVAQLASRVREAVVRHPAVTPLLLAHRQDSQASLRWGEAVLGVLAEAGFDGGARAIAFRTLLSYVLGALQVQHYSALDGPGTKAIAALSPESFPHLTATARAAQSVTPSAEFDEGLRILLDGLRGAGRRSQGR